jgi:hypothetical protein
MDHSTELDSDSSCPWEDKYHMQEMEVSTICAQPCG